MPIRQDAKNGYWYIDFTDANGKRVKRSSGTKDRKAAQELHDRLKSDSWREGNLGDTPDHKFEELAITYLKSIQGDKYYDAKAKMVGFWVDHFKGKPLRSISASMIKAALPVMSSAASTTKPKQITPATQNRYLASIGKLMSVAVELEWIDFAPKVKAKREPKVNVRWITHQEAERLIACADRTWIKNIIQFALATGCRAGEILSLDWSAVDMDKRHAYIGAENAKSGRGRAIPLNDLAITSMTGRERSGRVFTCNGNELSLVSHKAFQRACTAAGIEDLRFHDLRHTWASWHVQNGTPLMVLKELGGWQEVAMVQKYAHLGQSHLAQYADNTEFKPVHLKIAV
jgi:integrase